MKSRVTVTTHLPQEQRKQEIMESARKVFCKYGYDGGSLGKIAQEAGVSKALIVQYFGSKKRLAEQMIHDYLDRMMVVFRRSMQEPSGSFLALTEDMHAFVKPTRDELRFLITVIGIPSLENFSVEFNARYRAEMDQLLLPLIHQIGPDAAKTLIYIYLSILTAYALGGSEENFMDARNAIITQFFG